MAKQHENKTDIRGLVAEITHRTGKAKNGKDYLGGKVMIETGEDNIVPVDFFAFTEKNDGKENPVYKSLQSMVQEYKSVATDGEENADFISVGAGQLQENSFHTQNLALIRTFNVQAPFFNRVQKESDKTPKAEFTVVGEVINVVDEIKDDVPTGNAVLRLLIVGYGNRANIVDLHIENPQAVDYAKANYHPGSEVKVSGDIVVSEEIITEVTETGIGDPITEEKRRTERKLILKKATPATDSPITDEERTQMLSEREAGLEEDKQRKQAQANGGSKSKTKSASDFSL